MCINGGENSDGPKTCGQAGYVIYNTSPESFLKFKQVSNYEEFSRIDNYEYRFDILNDPLTLKWPAHAKIWTDKLPMWFFF